MTTGESCRGALTSIMGDDKGFVHPTVFPTRNRQDEVTIMDVKLYGVEVIANIGEDALRYLIYAYSLEIELRTGYWQENEDKVEQEERAYHDEGRTLEMFVATEEIKYRDAYEQQIIADVTHWQ